MANVIACALVQSRVDYANSLYTEMSSVNFDKLQLVQNTLARVVKKWDHVQPLLGDYTGYLSVNMSISRGHC